MSSIGAWSYDSLSAATAPLSDQCVSIEIPLSSTAVHMYQFGEVSADTGAGLREEWWRLWIPGADPANVSEYFAITWSVDNTLLVSVVDLTPDATKKPFAMAYALQHPFILIRVPRNKPFGYYRWSGGDAVGLVLRACRILPPTPPPGQ